MSWHGFSLEFRVYGSAGISFQKFSGGILAYFSTLALGLCHPAAIMGEQLGYTSLKSSEIIITSQWGHCDGPKSEINKKFKPILRKEDSGIFNGFRKNTASSMSEGSAALRPFEQEASSGLIS